MVTWKVCSSREKSVRHVQNTFWYISSRPYKTMDRNNQMNSSDHRGNLFSSHFDVSKVHLFYMSKWPTHGQGGKISRDLFNAIASFGAAKIKDHESIQSVRASRGVTSIETSLQNRTRISCILYLLYPSSKTREKNTCQPFAYKTYLNIKGRFIYF